MVFCQSWEKNTRFFEEVSMLKDFLSFSGKKLTSFCQATEKRPFRKITRKTEVSKHKTCDEMLYFKLLQWVKYCWLLAKKNSIAFLPTFNNNPGFGDIPFRKSKANYHQQ